MTCQLSGIVERHPQYVGARRCDIFDGYAIILLESSTQQKNVEGIVVVAGDLVIVYQPFERASNFALAWWNDISLTFATLAASLCLGYRARFDDCGHTEVCW